MTVALLIADMVNDFVTGKLACLRANRIIPNVQRLVVAAQTAGVPVIWCNDAHLPTDFELKIWGPHSMKGTKGAEIIPQLKPGKGNYIIEKRTYSAFFETSLDTILRAHHVDDVVITGLLTNICGIHTAADAFFRGYNPVIPEDGVEALDEKAHRDGLEYVRAMYHTELTTSDKLVRRWK
ncbi:MAG TPA: isochorismatase family cysteine hydrolase [Thermoplasmata archaeon]